MTDDVLSSKDHSPGWQDRYLAQLAAAGIYPDQLAANITATRQRIEDILDRRDQALAQQIIDANPCPSDDCRGWWAIGRHCLLHGNDERGRQPIHRVTS